MLLFIYLYSEWPLLWIGSDGDGVVIILLRVHELWYTRSGGMNGHYGLRFFLTLYNTSGRFSLESFAAWDYMELYDISIYEGGG